MKLQYYEMMDDKSKEYLLYLIEQVLPQFTESELNLFLEDFSGKKASKTKSANYIEIGKDLGKLANLSKLTIEQLQLMFQIFISREKSDKLSIKWRFYQYLKYMPDINVKTIKINSVINPDLIIDFIIETEKNEIFLTLCYDVLDIDSYNKAVGKINEFAKKENLIPDKIVIAVGKSFRNIPIDKPIKIINKELISEIWIELIEENLPFNREDLIIINDAELKLAGFNFTNIDDMLNYVYKYSNGGQISIYRQVDFFTEVNEDEPELELIWKGIMLK